MWDRREPVPKTACLMAVVGIACHRHRSITTHASQALLGPGEIASVPAQGHRDTITPMQRSRLAPMTLAVLAGLALCLTFAPSARSNLDGLEAGLHPSGAAYEINPDDEGLLWISDFGAGQVWGVDPDSGSYEVYSVLGSPIDARQADGWLWWADGVNNLLGRVSTSDGAYTHWQVTGVEGYYGTALDAEGRLWATDASSPLLYRLDPGQAELCAYPLPDGGMSYYVLPSAGYLWLGDWINGRLLRLKVSNNRLTWWALPEDSSPFGMAIDDQGDLWYADEARNVLARLTPAISQLVNFSLPQGTAPLMLAAHGGGIWYTEQSLASIGRLDPLTATATVQDLESGGVTLVPDCGGVEPAGNGYVTITTDDMVWSPGTYATLMEANGWQIFGLPAGARPWGISGAGALWYVDADRHVLGQIPTSAQVTACKVQDRDGDPFTFDDQISLEGWTLYLTEGGVRQLPGRHTRADGCTTWSDLSPGVSYGVEEDLPSGWMALTPTSHTVGLLEPGDRFHHTFVNARSGWQAFLPVIQH